MSTRLVLEGQTDKGAVRIRNQPVHVLIFHVRKLRPREVNKSAEITQQTGDI